MADQIAQTASEHGAEAALQLSKPVNLQSAEGELFSIDASVIELSNTVKNLLKSAGNPQQKRTSFKNSLGGQFSIEDNNVILKKEGRVLATLTKDTPEMSVIALHEVKSTTLLRVLEYCLYHATTTHNEKDRKQWNANFVQVDQAALCELASASYYLDIKPLVNLTSRAIATQVSGNTSDDIKETIYSINTDLYTPALATRYRLQKKINQKRLEEKKAAPSTAVADNRSVEELLQFIESKQPAKGKKKSTPSSTTTTNRKETKEPVSNEDSSPAHKHARASTSGTSKQQSASKSLTSGDQQSDREELSTGRQQLRSSSSSTTSASSNTSSLPSSLQSSAEITSNHRIPGKSGLDPMSDEFWERQLSQADEDDGLDPDTRAALDREVEEFRQRLDAVSQNARKNKLLIPMSSSEFMTKISLVDAC